jgi:uncharacterized membrane protein
MSRRALIIILIVSIGMNVGLFGFMAYDVIRETHRFHDRSPLPLWLDRIEGLTPDQVSRIRAIMSEGKEPLDKLRDDLGRKRQELNLLIADQNPDLAAIDEKIGEISGVQARMEQLIAHQIIAIRAVLTPEQRQLLYDYMCRMMPPHSGPGFEGGLRPGMGMGHGWGRGGPDR